ncbi:MAG: excinuclease ABC subunit UvrC [Bdellovibrionales bacterium]|nr:excinuclease ABC subunit UvrC [Bdellovibrionales bacterium]
MREENPHLIAVEASVKHLPKLPGVYIMKDAQGEVIYVGKAKSLRDRVRTYFSGGDGRYSIQYILARIATLEKIVTENEQQAFALESDLIKKFKPRYNIRLKDDKAYLHVRIDENVAWPRLELVRRIDNDGAKYFGPYTFSYELRTLLEVIKKVVPLRTCTDTVFYNRQRPCLEYQIKRCAGPCCIEIDRDDYMEWVDQAVSVLEGNTKPLVTALKREMDRASAELRFEDAGVYRDRIDILENFSTRHQYVTSIGENRDVFALYREETLVALTVLQVRNGRIIGSQNFSFSEAAMPDEALMESVLWQYYDSSREVPEEILLPFEVEGMKTLRGALKERRGRALQLVVPKRGIKFRLLGLAELNAKEHFISTFHAEARYQSVAQDLATLCRLTQMPRRIECVDISNFQGGSIVGALVCFYDGRPSKNDYRRYNISQQGKPDDFGAIYEVVLRRLQSGVEKDNLPDLLVIDGGKGQLAKALEARDELGIALDIISLAKMKTQNAEHQSDQVEKSPERIFLEGESEAHPLAPDAQTTHFMQTLRDEVHRFVITFHRKKRTQVSHRSVLDEIPGVGRERKGRLLKEFGSVSAMKDVPVEEIARVGRMTKALAQKIVDAVSHDSD